jgi:hypothetical protein
MMDYQTAIYGEGCLIGVGLGSQAGQADRGGSARLASIPLAPPQSTGCLVTVQCVRSLERCSK